MKLDVLNKAGESTGRSIEISDTLLTSEPNMHVVYLSVKQYLAHQRQGTHKAKERGEIAGSTRKLHKQKGTGGARKGDIKNPLYHGGGRIFGPRPRTYSIQLTKKTKRLAKLAVLSDKINKNKLVIVEDFTFDAPKTKDMMSFFANVKSENKPLLVTSGIDKNLYLSGRNIPKAEVTFVDELNVYDMVNAGTLIVFEKAMGQIIDSLQSIKTTSND
jgi:large subunit ribosomal protein L4